MNVAVETKPLVEVLKVLGPGVGSGKMVKALECVGFKGGQAMAFNGVFGVMHTNTAPWEFAVEYSTFNGMLSTFTDETVELDFVDGKVVISTSKGSKIRLNAISIEDFPFFSPDMEKFVEIKDENFIRALSAAITTTTVDATGGGNPSLWGVYFGTRKKGKKEVGFIQSYDKKRISYFEVKTGLANVCIPRPYAETIVKMGMPDSACVDGRFVYFKYGDVILFGQGIEGIYPDQSKFWDIAADKQIPITQDLLVFGKRAEVIGSLDIQYNDETKKVNAVADYGDNLDQDVDLDLPSFGIATRYFNEATAYATHIGIYKSPAGFSMIHLTSELPGFQLIAGMERR